MGSGKLHITAMFGCCDDDDQLINQLKT